MTRIKLILIAIGVAVIIAASGYGAGYMNGWYARSEKVNLFLHAVHFSKQRGKKDAVADRLYRNRRNGRPEVFRHESPHMKKHNARCYTCAADQFRVWNRANGKVMNGLTKRRAAERQVYMS